HDTSSGLLFSSLPRDLSLRSRVLFCAAPSTEIYPLSLHDALPISELLWSRCRCWSSASTSLTSPPRKEQAPGRWRTPCVLSRTRDRKSTRLNSSHGSISYAVFCLKKKK